MFQLWRMVLGCSTSGHSSRTAASETVHGTWSQGVCGRSVTRVSVTAGDGFGEFLTEVFCVTARNEPSAVGVGIVGDLHPDALRWPPRRLTREHGVVNLRVQAATGPCHVIAGKHPNRAQRGERHQCVADTKTPIIDDDRCCRGSRSRHNKAGTDHEDDPANPGAESSPVCDGHHRNDEYGNGDPPHAGDHSLSVRVRHAVIFPADKMSGQYSLAS